jgi:hypothetical protein
MSFKGPKELKKGASGWAQVRSFKDFPEDKLASLKVPGGPKQSEKSCDDAITRVLDGRGRRAGWKPIYNDIQKARYFSDFTRQQKSLELVPIFDKLGIKIFQSQQGLNCPTYVVRTPEFDGSRPAWWFDLPANIWESITPVFWGNWPSNWLYPPEEINPYINGRPEDSPLPNIPGLEGGVVAPGDQVNVTSQLVFGGISLSAELEINFFNEVDVTLELGGVSLDAEVGAITGVERITAEGDGRNSADDNNRVLPAIVFVNNRQTADGNNRVDADGNQRTQEDVSL